MSQPNQFVHLHVHSQYSLLDGAIRIDPLVERVQALSMPAVALTDHGNLFGALQFYQACVEADIKPILGCELNVVPELKPNGDSPGSSGPGSSKAAPRHLPVLVRSQEGYRNLVRLVSRGWTHGLRNGQPCVDLAAVCEQRAGLVGLSGCMGGVAAQEVLNYGPEAGKRVLGDLAACFEPGAFYVELQDHGFIEQGPLNRILVELAQALGLPIVATNDCHYLTRDDAHAQAILQCIGTGYTWEQMQRIHHASEELYVKSAEEMRARFSELPQALRATLELAEMCGGSANPEAKPSLPKFSVPDGTREEDYLRKLAAGKLEERFAELRTRGRTVDEAAYRARLQMECDVICSMGFAGYFLVVQDFINWAKERGIPVGPGRGSGAGSIVAYALRITDLDPLQYALLFERFLNPERVSMPDFDIDFCMDRRDEVIGYVRERYGESSVGQIATFHLLKSRSVVRDVARVMGMTPQDAGRIATLVPEPIQGRTVSIDEALKQEPRLKALYDSDDKVRELLNTARRLENLARHAGMHAAGLVISDGPLADHVPVFCPEAGAIVTQYSKDDVEAAGLVKFDFLGLRTLTVIAKACALIDKRPDRAGEPFDINAIALNDAATFALLKSGETTGVFQLESSGMQGLFKQLQPDTFEDVVAAVALYRPGPLGSGMVEDFIQRKHGRVRVTYPHPCLEGVLKPTYGVIVYQEQVMQAAQIMAGYTLGAADLLRRAMGKKKPEEMAQQKATFVEGSKKNGHSEQDAERVFELIAYFAGYGFNKSHSAAYALITYQTAYLKAHYPVEFMCATLSCDKDKIDKVVRTLAESRTMGIQVLPPDVNESAVDFTVVYDAAPEMNAGATKKRTRPVARKGKVHDALNPRIRFGLGGIRGVGSAAVEAIFEARGGAEGSQPFIDLFDFTARVDLRRVNKGVVEALVQSGAFDAAHSALGIQRGQAFETIDSAIDWGKKAYQERVSGQQSLFDALSGDSEHEAAFERVRPSYAAVEPWPTKKLLAREKGVLGLYLSGHPLDRYKDELQRLCGHTARSIGGLQSGQTVTFGAVVEGFRERVTKSGKRIAFFQAEDTEDRIEVVVREDMLERYRDILLADEPVIIEGSVQVEVAQGWAAGGGGGEAGEDAGATPAQAKVVLRKVDLLAQGIMTRTKAVCLRLDVEKLSTKQLRALDRTLRDNPGPCSVVLELASNNHWTVALKAAHHRVSASETLVTHVEQIVGRNVCEFR